MRFRPRDRNCPSYLSLTHPLQTEGAGKTGRWLAPAVRVQQKARGRTTGSAETTRPSLRGWFTGYTRSPRGPAFLPPSRKDASTSLCLASAPGRQDHATSPSAPSTVVCCRCASSAPRTPRIVTRRTSLFDEADAGSQHDFRKKEIKILKDGLAELIGSSSCTNRALRASAVRRTAGPWPTFRPADRHDRV